MVQLQERINIYVFKIYYVPFASNQHINPLLFSDSEYINALK